MLTICRFLLLFFICGRAIAGDWTVFHALGVANVNVGDPGGGWDISGSVARTSITIPGEMEKIKDSGLFEDKLSLLGSDRYSDVVAIFDLRRGLLLDQIRGYDMALSPSGRFIVFGHYYPPHGMHEVQSNLTVLYDLRKSPSENRVGAGGAPAAGQFAADQNVGIPIYPGGQVMERPYFVWIEKEEERRRMHVAGYVWTADESRVVFALLKGGESLLVVMDLNLDFKSAEVSELALKEIAKDSGVGEIRPAVIGIELLNDGRERSPGFEPPRMWEIQHIRQPL